MKFSDQLRSQNQEKILKVLIDPGAGWGTVQNEESETEYISLMLITNFIRLQFLSLHLLFSCLLFDNDESALA